LTLCSMANNLENVDYLWISLNMENSESH